MRTKGQLEEEILLVAELERLELLEDLEEDLKEDYSALWQDEGGEG